MADRLSDDFGNDVQLPTDLLWTDEFAWSPVLQSKAYSLTGALIVEGRGKRNGRPMTLQAGDTWGWCDRQVVEALWEMARVSASRSPAVPLTLVYRGASYGVIFDCEAVPVEARPVIDYYDPDNEDQYVLTLRLLQMSVQPELPPS